MSAAWIREPYFSPVGRRVDNSSDDALNEELVIAAVLKIIESERVTKYRLKVLLQAPPDALDRALQTQYGTLIKREGNKLLCPVERRQFICYKFVTGTCEGQVECKRFHICVKWIYDKCSGPCELPHTFRNDTNFSRCGFEGWDDEKIKFLVLGVEENVPEVCVEYSTSKGCLNTRCADFHVCTITHMGLMDDAPPCTLNHSFLKCKKVSATERTVVNIDQFRARLSLGLLKNPGSDTVHRLLREKAPGAKKRKLFLETTALWRFVDDNGKLQSHGRVAGVSTGLHVSSILEESYKRYELSKLILQIGSWTSLFDGLYMTETNMQTRAVRTIKRDVVNVRSDVPPDWDAMVSFEESRENAVAVPLLDPEGKEYKKIFNTFFRGNSMSDATILQVYRIQNPYLYKLYKDKEGLINELYSHYDDCTITENLLFHGTSPGAVKGICEKNFDWRLYGGYSGRSSYGQGAYFAKRAHYSHGYTKCDADGSRFMFVAKVLVGFICNGNSEMRCPPVWKDLIDYDTSVDNVEKPSIYVKYDKSEYYPAYLIQYRKN